MKRKIIQTKQFSKTIDSLFKKRQLLLEDFNDLQRQLIDFPEIGDLIVGTGGVRKARLKSASGGKSGGFRICYYFLTQDNELFLLLIYAKNVQENLTAQEKKELKNLVSILKGQNNE
ncbi:MAG TPA: type II toxin-antitoxin system RelE/ParE family toxin [Candidatus Babeliales bacterium]|nr:type II toxin-antitoxin system RelE/ParE family toxin [Candidatus Babeliales bacterium]